MTYRELFYKATRLINNNEITLGEYDEMTKPLNKEVEREERLEMLLYNAIDMLLAQYDRADILDNIGMTFDEYNQVMGTDKEV